MSLQGAQTKVCVEQLKQTESGTEKTQSDAELGWYKGCPCHPLYTEALQINPLSLLPCFTNYASVTFPWPFTPTFSHGHHLGMRPSWTESGRSHLLQAMTMTQHNLSHNKLQWLQADWMIFFLRNVNAKLVSSETKLLSASVCLVLRVLMFFLSAGFPACQ